MTDGTRSSRTMVASIRAAKVVEQIVAVDARSQAAGLD